MENTKRLWLLLGVVIAATMFILGWFGRELYRQVPPIPQQVVTVEGKRVMTRDDILRGQLVWQSIGGQQLGSIWGHGAYQAPDWSADWLHREATALRDILSIKFYHQPFSGLDSVDRAAVKARLKKEMRTNSFDGASGTVTVSSERAAAIGKTAEHYLALFGSDQDLAGLRESYALHRNAVPDPERRRALTAFFFWTSWAASTERPEMNFTYTNNWPHEPMIDNRPTTANLVWSIISVVILIAGIGGLVWYKVFTDREEQEPLCASTDPMDKIELTPSMRAAGKYCLTVIALFVVQSLLGGVLAHFTVEGNSFYGIDLSAILPYSVARTWHIQLALFWIATAFLAAGLFLAPAVGGREPRFQKQGVNVLFGALLLVVSGSLAGEWLSVKQVFNLENSFLFGHQGYEYIDLGRFWQILLFVGLVLWLILMLRGLWPAFSQKGHRRQLVLLFAGASTAIGLFYGAGFFYGARTHLTIMEYWRWWVVHLWVEGFFEVFATVAIAFIFTQLGLIRALSGTRAVLISSAIYLFGGIPGTFHHLYFSGTPISITAVGATFSALEVVPLALIGYEAWDTYRKTFVVHWMEKYKWPIRFFMGVAFWNLVGAGIFGFLINPPIALYYMQGLNTTPVHAHAALFGVYGLLSLGLILLVLRRLYPENIWNERPLAIAFWAMNGGLALMIGLSILPIGLAQTWVSIEYGLWYARSADFMQLPFLETLRWLRLVGDTVFLAGVGMLAYFVAGLITGWSYQTDHAGKKLELSPWQGKQRDLSS
ncbi:nitric-oxide reductase large subunit [Desulforhopalus singaporensis]|uniref:Nitric oxide reductase, NorZ apoprotein n=1 Tax=Desulforhopalus singaporensis TaxID=91360 RepID=A0A1H0T7T0_9BACT|nr:nitric-oxide reductase large subunit [Desulforhopalus singaporensis]SDP50103.1 nitric oxide reductase, NorZ apoprotein [Desulforhopalus singaporensis]